jgi:hypothetical protein
LVFSVSSKCSGAQVDEICGVDLEGGVVDEKVQCAELVNRSRHCFAAEVATGNIALDQYRPPAFGLHRGSGLLCIVAFAKVSEGDVGALAGE